MINIALYNFAYEVIKQSFIYHEKITKIIAFRTDASFLRFAPIDVEFGGHLLSSKTISLELLCTFDLFQLEDILKLVMMKCIHRAKLNTKNSRRAGISTRKAFNSKVIFKSLIQQVRHEIEELHVDHPHHKRVVDMELIEQDLDLAIEIQALQMELMLQ